MASMSFDGYVLASTGTIQTEDDYDDEEVDEEDKKARLTFTSVVSDNQWTIVLKKNEGIESVCMGTNWICAYTTCNNLRLFTYQGIENCCISMDKPVVCICGYENLLAVVYHNSIPLLGHQSMIVRVYNIHNLKIVFEKPVPLTANKKLSWFGFSEEGLLYSLDSEGVIRTLYNDIWMPVFEENEGAHIWVIGISESELRCVKLSEDDAEPNPLSKLNPKRIALKPVLMEKFFEPILSKKLNLYQENFKKDNFGYLKEASMCGKNDEKTCIRQGILNEQETRALTIETDKIKVDFVRKLLLEESFDKAIYIASQIETEDVFNKCMILMEKLGFGKQAKKAKEFGLENGMCQFLKANQTSTQVVPIHVIDQMIRENANQQQQNAMSNAQKLDRPNAATMKLSNYTGPYRDENVSHPNTFDLENTLYSNETYNTYQNDNKFMKDQNQKELDAICSKYDANKDAEIIKENKNQNVPKIVPNKGDMSLAKLDGINTNS